MVSPTSDAGGPDGVLRLARAVKGRLGCSIQRRGLSSETRLPAVAGDVMAGEELIHQSHSPVPFRPN